jgi:hypothetical protein
VRKERITTETIKQMETDTYQNKYGRKRKEERMRIRKAGKLSWAI